MSRILLLIAFFILLATLGGEAQCPMCRIAAESNLEHGGSAGKGLNTGILYMLMMPYFIVALIGYIWYRNRKKGPEAVDLPLSMESAN